jgi:hypothetical protein
VKYDSLFKLLPLADIVQDGSAHRHYGTNRMVS